MLTPQSVYADATRIYLAAYQNKLFVLARDRSADFPLIQTINFSSSLTAVRGDEDFLYVSAWDGILHIYRKTVPLQEFTNVRVADYRLSSLAVWGDHIYVGRGQSYMDVDSQYVYVAQLNEGDSAVEIARGTWAITQTYGSVFEPNITVAYHRKTASRRVGLPNDPNDYPMIYAADGYVMLAFGGCCGTDVWIYRTSDFTLVRRMFRSWINGLVKKGPFLIAGDESGTVSILDFQPNPERLLSRVRLPEATGLYGPEEIEIRSVWSDGYDSLIFAGSSWGNDQSRGTNLPSFFVLDMDSSPIIYTPPASVVTAPGNPVRFSVAALGRDPLSYQWQFNGTNLPGQINPQLALPSSRTADVGTYNVIVTNARGTNTSPISTLSFLNLTHSGNAVLHLYGPSGRRYYLEYRETLGANTPWSEMDTVSLTGNSLTFPDPPSSARPFRFYRATPLLP